MDSLVHVNYYDKKIIYIQSVLHAIRATKKYFNLKTDHYSGGMTGNYYGLKKKRRDFLVPWVLKPFVADQRQNLKS